MERKNERHISKREIKADKAEGELASEGRMIECRASQTCLSDSRPLKTNSDGDGALGFVSHAYECQLCLTVKNLTVFMCGSFWLCKVEEKMCASVK